MMVAENELELPALRSQRCCNSARCDDLRGQISASLSQQFYRSKRVASRQAAQVQARQHWDAGAPAGEAR